MSDNNGHTKGNLDSLVEEVGVLKNRMDEMAERMSVLESVNHLSNKEFKDFAKPIAANANEAIIGGVESLLPRVAYICFMLVFALILRTISDNGIIEMHIGSAIGLTYAIFLILWGWRLYIKESNIAPVFPMVGLMLLFSVVLELNLVFKSLPSNWAVGLLVVAELIIVMLALRYKLFVLLYLAALGTFGAIIAILVKDFQLNHLFIAVFMTSLVAYLAARRNFGKSLRWIALLFTLGFFALWSSTLTINFGAGKTPEESMAMMWFFPALTLAGLFHLYAVIRRILDNETPLKAYSIVMPSINATFVFWASYPVVQAWLHNMFLLGIISISFGLLHFIVLFLLLKRKNTPDRTPVSLVSGGILLLFFGMPFITGSIILSIPLWSVTAYLVSRYSKKCECDGTRVVSYLLQVLAFITALFIMTDSSQNISLVAGMSASLLLAIVGYLHYNWCRNNPPTAKSLFFSEIDKKDRTSIILMFSSMAGVFLFLRLGLWEILQLFYDNPKDPFSSLQSVLVNIGAIMLMVWGLKSKKNEILLGALVLMLWGGIKVFIFDMFQNHGIPLVLAVFTFGIVAMTSSVVFNQWQKQRSTPTTDNDQ